MKKTSCEIYNRGECKMDCSYCPDVYGFEKGTDADFDRYSVQVQNGEGFYDESGKFHYYNCPTIKNHGAPYFVTYNSRETAIADGYIPCKRCSP